MENLYEQQKNPVFILWASAAELGHQHSKNKEWSVKAANMLRSSQLSPIQAAKPGAPATAGPDC